MLTRTVRNKRRGSVLVEYALLIAGIVLVCVVAIAVLGHKTSDMFGVMATVMPGAHVEDNLPIASQKVIEFKDDGTGKLVLDPSKLVDPGGKLDRMATVLGTGGGELLVVDQ